MKGLVEDKYLMKQKWITSSLSSDDYYHEVIPELVSKRTFVGRVKVSSNANIEYSFEIDGEKEGELIKHFK